MKRFVMPLLAFAMLGLIATLTGCERSRPWNVLVITLDTTRADFLGCYGKSSARTPNLDQLASQGFLFRQAMSAVPITLPSHSTMFTGTYPPVHGVRDNGLFQLPETSTTLAEILQARGYATAAAVGAFPLGSEFGIHQGFDFYDDHVTLNAEDLAGQRIEPKGKGTLFFDERSAVQVNDAILPWLRQHLEKPFFVWIHYWDAHQPHIPPAPFSQLYQNDLYQGEIAFVDQSLGAVLRTLSEGGVDERTLIVVVGDHGEGRGEHYEDTHSMLAYNSTLQVPLIFRVPGRSGGKAIARRVGTVDILPTLLDLLGITDGPEEIQGRSLGPLLDAASEGRETSGRVAYYAETLSPRLSNGWGELRVLFRDQYKYIHGPRPELFDLDTDPGEIHNLLAEKPEVAAELRADLTSFLKGQSSARAASAIKAADAEVRERLAALGYLSASGEAPDSITEALLEGGIAPQDRVADNRLSSLAKQQISAGQFLQARDAAEALVKLDPQNAFYRGLLAMSLLGLGQPEHAAEVADQDESLAIQNHSIFLEVARELFSEGHRDRGLALVERLLAERDSAAGRYLKAEMRAELGDRVAYEEELRAALALDASHSPSRLSLAILLAQQGERAAADELFKTLLRDHPLSSRYHFNYAAHLLTLLDSGAGSEADSGTESAALEHLERAIELSPGYWKAHLQLLSLRRARGETQEAEKAFRRLEGRCRDAEILRQARALMAPSTGATNP